MAHWILLIFTFNLCVIGTAQLCVPFHFRTCMLMTEIFRHAAVSSLYEQLRLPASQQVVQRFEQAHPDSEVLSAFKKFMDLLEKLNAESLSNVRFLSTLERSGFLSHFTRRICPKLKMSNPSDAGAGTWICQCKPGAQHKLLEIPAFTTRLSPGTSGHLKPVLWVLWPILSHP